MITLVTCSCHLSDLPTDLEDHLEVFSLGAEDLHIKMEVETVVDVLGIIILEQ